MMQAMHPRDLLFKFSATASVAVAVIYFSGSVRLDAGEFATDFQSVGDVAALQGEGAGQFDFVGQSGEAVTISIQEGAFQAEIAYDLNDQEPQNSGARLTRTTPFTASSTTANHFLVLQIQYTVKPRDFLHPGTSLLNVSAGQNFRLTPFNPARDNRSDEGPAFAALSIIVARSEGEFSFLASSREASPKFISLTDSAGNPAFELTLAFNSGETPVSFDSPSGPVEISPGCYSIWNGEELVWENQPSQNPAAKLEHFSIGIGSGTDLPAEEGSIYEGIYRLGQIKAFTSKPN